MVPTTTRSPARASDEAVPVLGERFADALSYATHLHSGQTRRGTPYVAHLLRVTGLVLEDGGTEDEAIAALLHDAAEDHGGLGRLHDIRRRYGDEVAGIVDACTDSWYYASLAQLFERLQPGPRARELTDLVDELRRRTQPPPALGHVV